MRKTVFAKLCLLVLVLTFAAALPSAQAGSAELKAVNPCKKLDHAPCFYLWNPATLYSGRTPPVASD